MQDPDSMFRRHLTRLNQLIDDGGSLSGHESNCAFLNVEGGRFATVSAVSGLDFPDDARTPVCVDWDRDGDLDLWVGNRTAPQLRLMRNDTPSKNHFLALRLRGHQSNRDGIGARVEVWQRSGPGSVAPLIKTLKAGDGFLGQSSKWLHFGLGAEADIDRVIVRWPGGEAEAFAEISADSRYVLEEGEGRGVAVALDPIRLAEPPGPAPRSPEPGARRIVTSTRTGLPPLRYTDFDGQGVEIPLGDGAPILINLWASWCTPCLEELAAWKSKSDQFEAAGVRIFALSVDGLDGRDTSTLETSRAASEKRSLPIATGMADEELYARLEQAHNWPFGRRIPMPVPTSFLVDGKGRLTVIYRGTVAAQQALADLQLFELSHDELRAAALPFPGRWLFPPQPPGPMLRGIELMEAGDVGDAAEFVLRNLELLKPHKEFPLLAIWISEKLMNAGETGRGLQFLQWAAEGDGTNVTVINNLAWQLAANPSERVRNPELALKWANRANAMTGGKHPAILDTVAVAYAAAGDFASAIKVIELGIAAGAGDEAVIGPMRDRLQLFRLGKPYFDPAPSH